MSLNKILNRPLFRKEALRRGALKTINANVGVMVGQPTTPAPTPAVVPGQGVYSRVNTQRFGPPKPTRMQNLARNPFVRTMFNIPFAGGYYGGEKVAEGLGIKNPLLQMPFGMAGGYAATKALPTLAAAPAGISAALLAGPAYLMYAGGKEKERIAKMSPKEREAHRRKSMQFGMSYLDDEQFNQQFKPKPIEEKVEEDKKIIAGKKRSYRTGFENRAKELKAEGDELLQNANEEDVANLTDIQSKSLGNIGPVPPGEESVTPTVTEKETVETDTDEKKGNGKDDLGDAIVGVDNKDFKTADGEAVTDGLINRAREISKQLRAGQSSQANLVFLANLASGLLSGTTTRRGIGGAMEVFGRALGPAVNNYATLKLKENELENNFMQSALEIASDEIERKNQVYDPPEGVSGVVQILQNGKPVNLTAIRLKDGTVRAAIPGQTDNGRNVYTTLAPGSYVRFESSDKLAKPQIDLLRELDAKYRAYALGQKTIKILEDFQARGETGAGPIGRFNLFKQRFGSAFKDVLGRDIYDDMESAQRRLEKEKNKAISDLMVSEDISREKAEKLLQSQLGDAADQNKIMKLIKDATGEEDKQKLSQLAINETVMVYALANSLKSKDRLTEKDIKMAKQLVNIFPLLRGQADVIRDLRSVNNTILGDIDSLQSNWVNGLLGETATINLYRRQYGFAEGTDNDLPPELADIYQGKTDQDIAGSITLN
jgi:hypothetical protein